MFENYIKLKDSLNVIHQASLYIATEKHEGFIVVENLA